MINYSRSDRFDVGSPNLFLATALSFEREASRVSKELRTNLNKSAIRMAIS
jgi:UTP-glucose-1-phosphate uridylyltransferase